MCVYHSISSSGLLEYSYGTATEYLPVDIQFRYIVLH